MVYFVCTACQETVKKTKVDSHCGRCRQCWVLVCVDCQQEFEGEDYRSHNQCISEAEKYQGALYRAPTQKKKRNPQEEWMAAVQRSADDSAAPPRVAGVLSKLRYVSNVPRKIAKFKNFAYNSVGIRDMTLLQEVFDFIMARWPKPAPAKPAAKSSSTDSSNGADKAAKAEAPASSDKKRGKKRSRSEVDEEGGSSGGAGGGAGAGAGAAAEAAQPFRLKKAIKSALKEAPDSSMKLKKLRKLVHALPGASAITDFKATFLAQIESMSKVEVEGKVVKLRSKKH